MFIMSQFDYEQHRSNKKDDMDYLFWESIRTICIEIGQVILYHRIIRTRDDGLPILPKGFVPQHLNPLKRIEYNKKTLKDRLDKIQIDELYNKIEDVVGDTDLMEGKDMPLEMVRALNILNNEIDKSVYKKKMEFGKKYSKVRDKIISASKFLTKLVSKMR